MNWGAVVRFRNPPVVETVLSVQFKPLEGIGAAQLGAYWAILGDAWPNVADAPALEKEIERFGAENRWEPSGLMFKVQSQPDVRLQIQNAARDRMIQVQNGRFLFNWIGSGEDYPSYEVVRPQFDHYWDQFRSFLLTKTSSSIEPDQWEVVYVNHIPRGDLWSLPSEITSILEIVGAGRLGESAALLFESASGEWRYEIPKHRGRLYIRLGRTMKDSIPHIVVTLIARGSIRRNSELTLDSGLALGHDVITQAFPAITSDKAQKHWGPL